MAGREEEGSLSREECQEDAGPGDGLRHVVKELEGGFHQKSARPDHQAPARHGPFANLRQLCTVCSKLSDGAYPAGARAEGGLGFKG
jgi:hypothetical protein